jgi:aminoglycoside phosphotransferase (APT) family kinase protein
MAAKVPASGLSGVPEWALARVPGLEDGRAPLWLAPLPGGSVNRVFRVDTMQGRFVLRLDGEHWRRPGVDRQRELALHRIAASAGLAPAIAHADPAAEGILVSEYLEGRLWREADFDSAASVSRLGGRLAVLHGLAAPPVAPFDAPAIAHGYVEAMAAREGRDAPADNDVVHVLGQLQAVSAALQRCARAACVVHGDLAAANLLQGSRLWLLDWEYAQLADPLNDVACVLAYYPNARRHCRALLAAAGFAATEVGEELERREYVYRALAWLWHRARGEGKLPRP